MKFVGTMRTMLCLTATLASLCPLLAQEGAGPYQFSKQGQAVLQRLSTLDSISARDWQYHEGAVLNGESSALSTADWKTVSIPFVAPRQEVWLRRWVKVPKTLNGYDLTGARLSFQMEVGGDGPGHGYLLGETRSMVALRALLEARGLAHEAIFVKGYWNIGRPDRIAGRRPTGG